MNVLVKRCSLSVSLVVIFINLVNGLKCFECTLSDPSCANPTSNNVSIVDCNLSIFTIRPENILSRKRGIPDDMNFQCLTTIERTSEEVFYTRRCALSSEKKICEDSTTRDNESRIEKCSLCDKDYCNSSMSLSFSFIHLLLLLCLIFIYK